MTTRPPYRQPSHCIGVPHAMAVINLHSEPSVILLEVNPNRSAMAQSMADCIGGSIEMPSLLSGDRALPKNVKIRFTIFTAIFDALCRPQPTAASRPEYSAFRTGRLVTLCSPIMPDTPEPVSCGAKIVVGERSTTVPISRPSVSSAETRSTVAELVGSWTNRRCFGSLRRLRARVVRGAPLIGF
jgi:hypothetical protein